MSTIARGSSHPEKIHFTGPSITDLEIEHVIDAVKNGWLDQYNHHVHLLEDEIKKQTSIKHVLATHTGTAALHLCTSALGLGPGDEVICVDFSYVATSYAIDYVGATPVFVDIEPDSWCIDPKKIEQAITSKTKAIMMVHTYGHMADMPAILEIAKKYNLKVIEDAAAAVGSSLNGKLAGTWGDVGIFSFNGTKIVGAGEGGCVMTNDAKIFSQITSLASMGRTDLAREFWSEQLGFQYCIGNLSAAVAIGQVKRIEELVAKKRQIYSWYTENMKGWGEITFQKEREGSRANWSYPTVILNEKWGKHRDQIVMQMKEKKVIARATFPQMRKLPIHQSRQFECPNSDRLSNFGFSLPSALHLNQKQITTVCETLRSVLDKLK